jgi:hypothetical protein
MSLSDSQEPVIGLSADSDKTSPFVQPISDLVHSMCSIYQEAYTRASSEDKVFLN